MQSYSKAATSLVALLLISMATAPGVVAEIAEEPLLPVEEERVVDLDVAREFPAPFVSAHFLNDVQLVLIEERILSELTTQTIWDLKSRLMWPTLDNGLDVDWKRAEAYCDELSFAGFADWRLPSIEELETLHRVMSNVTYKLPNEIRLSACCPWSSTQRGARSAWNYNFRSRKRFSGTVTYSYDHRALCVRTPGLEEIPVETQIPARQYYQAPVRRGRG